jgi:uncharacterized coiled-coil DUF342 family protein
LNWHNSNRLIVIICFKNYKKVVLIGRGQALELAKFDELEEKIKGIVEECSFLKKKNQELEKLSKDKDGELKEANRKIKELNDEWDAVRAKVDSLLGMLKDISVT